MNNLLLALTKFVPFLPYFIGSFIISVLFTPWVIWLLKKLDMVQYPPDEALQKLQLNKDDPNLRYKIIAAKRRQLKPPTAVGGGISYVLIFLVFSIIALFLSNTINITPAKAGSYILWLAGLLVVFVVGILDDRYELNGKQQFASHILGTLLFLLSDFDLKYINIPGGILKLDLWRFAFDIGIFHLSLSLPGDLILFFWIITLILAIKTHAGIDSLMEGNTVIATLFIVFVSLMFGQNVPALFATVLAGALLGYSIYNFYPAYVFSGSSGEASVGYLIATLAVISKAKFGVTLIMLAIPVVDLFYVIVKRIFYYKLYSPPKRLLDLFTISDRLHLHYRLLKLGLTEPQVDFLEYSITFVIGIICLLVGNKHKYILLFVVWTLVLAFVVIVNKLADIGAHKEDES